jgi:hypothetical protein
MQLDFSFALLARNFLLLCRRLSLKLGRNISIESNSESIFIMLIANRTIKQSRKGQKAGLLHAIVRLTKLEPLYKQWCSFEIAS